MRVRIVTPEEAAAERKAGIVLAVVVLTVAVQMAGVFYLSTALQGGHLGHASLGSLCVLLAAWIAQLVDARGRRRPFRWRKFILGICISITLVLALPTLV
ncbi:hypothetical protein [Streptomyces sp. NPDC055749]